VCCLEQDFPIAFRTPIVLREVLLCGTCLVAATEVIRKLPGYAKLPHGYGCVAIEDVNDIDTMSKRLAAIVEDPAPAAEVGLRGHAFARALQRNASILDELERILEAAAARRRISGEEPQPAGETPSSSEGQFQLTALAAAAIQDGSGETGSTSPAQSGQILDLAAAREVLAAIERGEADCCTRLPALLPAVQTEIAVAAAEQEIDDAGLPEQSDPLFRLHIARWAVAERDIGRLTCTRSRWLRVLAFAYDVSQLMGVRTAQDLAAPLPARPSYLVAFGRGDGGRRDPFLVDGTTARILDLSDGTRSAAEIVAELNREFGILEANNYLKRIQHLFIHDLISLQDGRVDLASEVLPKGAEFRGHPTGGEALPT
jgi:hypothetical protein